MLTAEQQERYARHLLLDGLDQERVMAASVRVEGTGVAAHWAARYLAASGVGGLEVEEHTWEPELRGLAPWAGVRIVQLVQDASRNVPVVQLVHAPDGATPAESAMNGAMAAVEALRKLAT